MDINFSIIKDRIQESPQFIWEKGGKLASRVVKECRKATKSIKQDPRLCGVTVGILNIAFLYTAFGITCLVEKLWTRWCGEEDPKEQTYPQVRDFSLLTVFSGVLVGLNVILFKGLKHSIGKWAFTAVSVASCTGYVLLSAIIKDKFS